MYNRKTITILNPSNLYLKREKNKIKMEKQSQNSSQDYLSEFTTHLIDIEEKQRLIKDRVLLIGENLISTKEEQEIELFEIKRSIKNLEGELKSIKQLVSRLTNALPDLARKSELEILKKQWDMFEPFKIK